MTSKKYYRRAVRCAQAFRAAIWVFWLVLSAVAVLNLWDESWALIAYNAVFYVMVVAMICYGTRLANGAIAAYRQERLPVEVYKQIGKWSILWDLGVPQESRA